jgi:ABC-2 type transport system ATP-binding protein
MTATKGYFILQSSNLDELQRELELMSVFKEIKREENKLIASIEQDISAEDLNKHLSSKGICLSHLVKQKESLEEQFLELVKTK